MESITIKVYCSNTTMYDTLENNGKDVFYNLVGYNNVTDLSKKPDNVENTVRFLDFSRIDKEPMFKYYYDKKSTIILSDILQLPTNNPTEIGSLGNIDFKIDLITPLEDFTIGYNKSVNWNKVLLEKLMIA